MCSQAAMSLLSAYVAIETFKGVADSASMYVHRGWPKPISNKMGIIEYVQPSLSGYQRPAGHRSLNQGFEVKEGDYEC